MPRVQAQRLPAPLLSFEQSSHKYDTCCRWLFKDRCVLQLTVNVNCQVNQHKYLCYVIYNPKKCEFVHSLVGILLNISCIIAKCWGKKTNVFKRQIFCSPWSVTECLCYQNMGLTFILFGEWRLACPECPWLTDQVLSAGRLYFHCLMKVYERRLNGREGQNNNHYQSPSFCFISLI